MPNKFSALARRSPAWRDEGGSTPWRAETSATFPYELLKSGGGPPQSKTLARDTMIPEIREAFWSAPVLWRFASRRNVREISACTSEKRWRATAVQDAGASFGDYGIREASWSAPVLWRFPITNPHPVQGHASLPDVLCRRITRKTGENRRFHH
jgi:hypothetical protein